LAEKKTTLALYCTENFKQKILDYIGYNEQSGKSISESLIEYFKKLLLDKSSPAPNSPNGEQKTEITQTSEQKPSSEKWTPAQQRAIELAYEKRHAVERAKAEGVKMREHAKLEAKNQALQERLEIKEKHATKRCGIDMGDSAGVPDDYIF
jgi:hypothetical protein